MPRKKVVEESRPAEVPNPVIQTIPNSWRVSGQRMHIKIAGICSVSMQPYEGTVHIEIALPPGECIEFCSVDTFVKWSASHEPHSAEQLAREVCDAIVAATGANRVTVTVESDEGKASHSPVSVRAHGGACCEPEAG